MSDADAIAVYCQHLSSAARALPFSEMVAFLRGAVLVAGEHEAIEPFRDIYARLVPLDDQLELIASAQLRLPLEGVLR